MSAGERTVWDMCGRFVSSSPADQIARYFDVDRTSEEALAHEPDHNTAPTTDVLVVVEEDGARSLDCYRWGLVPGWADDLKVGNRMINARAESLAEKPAYRRAFARRRCLVPIDGFYEWQKVASSGTKRKQPWYVHRPDGEPYAVAGLWEQWRGALPGAGDDGGGGEEVTVRSMVIVTGEPNDAMARIHDRMPVILPPESWDEWLSPEQQDVAKLQRLLVPAPSALTAMHPVSTEVNNVRNNGEHLTREVDPHTGEPIGPGQPPAGRLL